MPLSPRSVQQAHQILTHWGLVGLTTGEPTRLYHGTTRSFQTFSLQESRRELVDHYYGVGLFFTPSLRVAWKYANANRNIGLPATVIQDLATHNRMAANVLSQMVEKGEDASDLWTREFFRLGPDDDFVEAITRYCGGLDPNTLWDVARWIHGSALEPPASDDLMLFSTATGMPGYVYDQLDELGIDSATYRPKVMTVEVRASRPLVTASRQAAKAARRQGYDAVVFYGSNLVDQVPEVMLWDPGQIRITHVEVDD